MRMATIPTIILVGIKKYRVKEERRKTGDKTKSGAHYETPILEVALIGREDVIATSGDVLDDYDENGWT